jgi:hypothetical protein
MGDGPLAEEDASSVIIFFTSVHIFTVSSETGLKTPSVLPIQAS